MRCDQMLSVICFLALTAFFERTSESHLLSLIMMVFDSYGVQFHPEVDLTERGQELLSNFLFRIARLSGSFTMQSREETAISYLRGAVGAGADAAKVLCLVSGGVDSSVCAALLKAALPAERVRIDFESFSILWLHHPCS